jgi:hypothetical protein
VTAGIVADRVVPGMVLPSHSLWVQVRLDYRGVLAWVADEGLGHHWMAAYGDLRRPLAHLARTVGCDWTGIG